VCCFLQSSGRLEAGAGMQLGGCSGLRDSGKPEGLLASFGASINVSCVMVWVWGIFATHFFGCFLFVFMAIITKIGGVLGGTIYGRSSDLRSARLKA